MVTSTDDIELIPTHADICIVGGGVIGTSIAYHLAQLGKSVVLLEQGKLGGGSSWHAAGMVGQLRASNSMTKINKYTVELYSQLKEITGHDIGWKQVGSLIVAKSQDRLHQLQRTIAMAELFGVEASILSPEEAFEKWPLIRTDDLLGAAWLPHDGKCKPGEVPKALAKGARALGAQVFEGVEVVDIEVTNGVATGVITKDYGRITANKVVLAGGMWTRDLGLRCGVKIPLYPCEHHYVVTEPLPKAFDELPLGRDPDLMIYFRGEGEGIMLGAFQEESKAWKTPIAPDFTFQLFEPDWAKFTVPLANGRHRIPALETCKFDKFVNGPESFTPDNNFIMGEAPEVKDLFVAAGLNSVGIASAGGVGKYLAQWITSGEAPMDLWSVDIKRFHPTANEEAFLKERVTEVLGLHYQMAWPNREFVTSRNIRKSALHDTLLLQGAFFQQKMNLERPAFFYLPEDICTRPPIRYSFGRQSWFGNYRLEHLAAREAVALFDQSGFTKYKLSGPGSMDFIQRICAGNMDVAVGRAIYTGMFNRRGTYESDVVVVRDGPTDFYMISGSSQMTRDISWMRMNMKAEELVNDHVVLADVSEDYAVIGVFGPNSRTLLSRVTSADMSNEAFPFGTSQFISINDPLEGSCSFTIRAIRVTYVGELGWECHVAPTNAVRLHQLLIAAGRDLGVTNAGHYAINSLRLEKGYRAWGADIGVDDNAIEAGLGFSIAWKKSDFLGKDALVAAREQQKAQGGLHRQLLSFVVTDPEPTLWGMEPILRNGKTVGYTSSGSYGHSVGGAVALGYVKNITDGVPAIVTNDWIEQGSFEILINGTKYPAKAFTKAPYDHERSKIMA